MAAQLHACGESKDYLKSCVHEDHIHVLLGLKKNHIAEGAAKYAELDRQITWWKDGINGYDSHMVFACSISGTYVIHSHFWQ